MKQTILITGGAGFIGSTLCKSLLSKDNIVICLDNFDNYYSPKIKHKNIHKYLNSENFHLEKGDIRDGVFLNNVFTTYNITSVVHLAGKGGVRKSIENITEYFDVNVTGTITLLEVMKKNNVNNFVFASSSSIYGESDKLLEENDCSNHQISPYATTKKTIELVNYNYHINHNFNIVNLRLFSVYGNNQRPDLFIHKVFKAIFNDDVIEIYGDGLQTRDFTHITDVIFAIQNSLRLCQNQDNIYETINIGSQNPISVNRLIEVIEKVTELTVKRKYISKQIGDVNSTFANVTKAKNILNYSPSIGISEGIKKYFNWFKNNENDRNT